MSLAECTSNLLDWFFAYFSFSGVGKLIFAGGKFVRGVVGTAEQYSAGVVDTVDKHSFTLFKKSWNDPKGILKAPGDTDSLKKSWKSLVRRPVNRSRVISDPWFSERQKRVKSDQRTGKKIKEFADRSKRLLNLQKQWKT